MLRTTKSLDNLLTAWLPNLLSPTLELKDIAYNYTDEFKQPITMSAGMPRP